MKTSTEVTIMVTDEVTVDVDGQIIVDGKVIAGISSTDPRTIDQLEKEAAKYLAIASFLKKQRDEEREQRILATMYHVFISYHGRSFVTDEFVKHMQGKDRTLATDARWRRVAETIVRLEDLKK